MVFFLPPIISPLHFTPILSHYSNFLPLWYTYISPNHFNALKTPQKRPAFMVAPFIGGNLHPIGGKIKSVFEDTKTRQNLFWWAIRQATDAPNLVRKCSHFLWVIRQDHASIRSWRNGKPIWNCHTFVVPLYRYGNSKKRTRQPTTASVFEDTSTHRNFRWGVVKQGKARQGKANTAIPQLRMVHGSIWNCHTFVVPLYCWIKDQ